MCPASQSNRPAPATASEIRNILRDPESAIVAAILKTGATCAEVLRAFEWEEEDEYIGAGPEAPEGLVKLVYDILRGDREMSLD